jgi:hypothetical protein
LLWRDNFAKHLLINRSQKPDTPTNVSCLLLPLQALLISQRALLLGAILLIGSPQSKYSRSEYFILHRTHNFQDSNNLWACQKYSVSEYFILRRTHNFQDSNNLWACQNIQCLNILFCVERIIFKVQIICGISVDNFASSSFWSLYLKMADDDSLPWGTMQCAGKLEGHILLDWSFYALILVFPVILFGGHCKE